MMESLGWGWYAGISILGLGIALFVVIFGFILLRWGAYWFQAYVSGADISMRSLIAMSFLGISPRLLVSCKIMAKQAGLSIDHEDGMTTARMQAHVLAGGNVLKVVQANIAAKQAGIELDFDRAAAIDLAGRDVLLAVQTSISPMVIRCPSSTAQGPRTLSAVAKNGVELLVDARVTVRTQLNQLIGGATEETIIARVGQGIITAIGSAESHMDVLAMPSRITKGAMMAGLDSNTAFAIVSIDIYLIEVGQNIGARLLCDQAEADLRIARASAEGRRAEAVALTQQMRAKLVGARANVILAEAEIPPAIADAFLTGKIVPLKSSKNPPLNFSLLQAV